MAKTASLMTPPNGVKETPDFEAILNAMASAVLVISNDDNISYLNNAGEQLFQSSIEHISKNISETY